MMGTNNNIYGMMGTNNNIYGMMEQIIIFME